MAVSSPLASCFQAQVTATRLHCLREEIATHSSQLLNQNQELPSVGGMMEATLPQAATPLPPVLSWTKKREPGTEADWAPSHNHDTGTQL